MFYKKFLIEAVTKGIFMDNLKLANITPVQLTQIFLALIFRNVFYFTFFLYHIHFDTYVHFYMYTRMYMHICIYIYILCVPIDL